MLIHMGIFGQVDRNGGLAAYKDACNQAFADFNSWRKSKRISCSVKRFNYYGLFTDTYGTFMNQKGHNARVISEWLLELCTRVRQMDFPSQASGRVLGKYPILFQDERMHMSECALILAQTSKNLKCFGLCNNFVNYLSTSSLF